MKKQKTNKPTHWKSLEEKHQDPKFLADNADEFPELAPSRRDFLKLMGFTLATASLVACTRTPVHKAIPFLNKPDELTPGLANWYATTCAGCTAGCALLVKSRDGRPIKVEGNPDSPMARGGVCAVGQASLLGLYDESRLRGPLWGGQGVTWGQLDEQVQEKLSNSSGKIVLLTGTLLSPSSKQLIQEFLKNYPNAQHIQYDPISSYAIRLANQKSFNTEVIPDYRFDKAKVIVGINADFLGAWISPVEYTARYIQNRKLNQPIQLSKHIQLESDYSLTGSNADQRIPITAGKESAIVLALLNFLYEEAGKSAPGKTPSLGSLEAQLKDIARQLWKHRGESLIVSGSNDVNVQTAINAMNAMLGNIGTTVDLDNPSYQKQGNDQELMQLVKDMNRGSIGALFIGSDVNPAYDNPLAGEFQKALQQVPFSLSFSNYRDETAQLTQAVSPDLNFLEAWNDAQPKANVYHLTQPLIAPLFDNRAWQDSLLRWMDSSQDYYAYLQNYWAAQIFPKQMKFLSAKKFWNQSVHDGYFVLPENLSQPRTFSGDPALIARQLQKATNEKQGFGLQLYESVCLREGRTANNPWNQECPDPVTKVTWDNYVKIAPSTAKKLGIKQEDVVKLQHQNKALELPVHIQPGMAPQTISIALGYGRQKAGKVGNQVGQDLYPWMPVGEPSFGYALSGVKISPTGKRADLATTQTHGYMEGRPIIKETILDKWLKNPKAGNEDHVALFSLWPKWKGAPEKWGMSIDLNACTGCSACVISCQVENNVPVVGKDEVWRRREMHWMRIDRYYTGSEDQPEAAHQPMLCQHCANAPCETVCPVLATVHSSDGLNQQVYNRCVGTRYCANNCPYKVRRFNWFDYAGNPKFDYYLNNDLGRMVLNPDVVVRSRGVMEKCSMCVQRIQEGKLQAKQEGRELKDGEIQTACQQSCPSQAIVFGNLKDEKSQVAKQGKNKRSYAVLEELNIQPAIEYLTKVRNKG